MPEGGDYDTLPDDLRKYGASDYAVTGDGGDFTEHAVGGIASNGDLYLLDWWYGQTPTDVWVEHFLDLGPLIERRMKERGVYVFREQFAGAHDKRARAQAIRGRMSMGKVKFPVMRAPWVKHVVAQLLSFPAGKHDDAVDVLGLFGRMFDQMDAPRADKPRRPPRYRGPDAWMG